MQILSKISSAHLRAQRGTACTVRGFTLIELIVVVSIFAMMMVLLGTSIAYLYRGNDYVVQEGTAVENAQLGLTNAMENLREASYGDDGSYPIASAATSSITFYADVDDDGDVEMVRYSLLGNTLYRAVTNASSSPPSYAGQPAATTTLATYVQNGTSTPAFQYFDASGTPLTAPISIPSIASITTTLKIDVDPNRSPNVYTLIGSATLRNLRSY